MPSPRPFLTARPLLAALLAVLPPLLLPLDAGAQPDCGTPGTMTVKTPDGKGTTQTTTRVFADGSVAVRARLAVNPDGGAASYTAGDAGFTYIANGLDRWSGGKTTSCQAGGCRPDFLKAEQMGFGPGSPAFCVYAIEVDPYTAGGKRTACGPGKWVVGDGLGKPKPGPVVEGLSGQPVQTYSSMTSVTHRVEGQTRYLDAEALPIAVAPAREYMGKLVWVGGAGFKPTLALIGDRGPAFGEGSIALHQLLRTGSVTRQKPGPIPREQRCGPGELDLKPPFISRPGGGSADRCRPGRTPTTASDVRAYQGIDIVLDFVILGQAALPRKGMAVQEEVSLQSMTAAAAAYTPERVQQMLACLPM
jgi:hypothetical protein